MTIRDLTPQIVDGFYSRQSRTHLICFLFKFKDSALTLQTKWEDRSELCLLFCTEKVIKRAEKCTTNYRKKVYISMWGNASRESHGNGTSSCIRDGSSAWRNSHGDGKAAEDEREMRWKSRGKSCTGIFHRGCEKNQEDEGQFVWFHAAC